jgi:hypothetical protein
MVNYSDNEIATIESSYKIISYEKIAKMLGCSETKVKTICRKFGFIRTAEENAYFKSLHQFKAGEPCRYKPAKGSRFSVGTEFKKGHSPVNTRKVGDVALRQKKSKPTEKYYYLKIGEPNRWQLLHRHNWEKVNGKIPKCMLLRCIDGNSLNCEVSNWVLINKNYHIRLNHNKDKTRAAMLRNWENGKMLENENIVLNAITKDKELKEEIRANHKDLISLKRNQLKLKRKLKNGNR